jgi:hypothetical protein
MDDVAQGCLEELDLLMVPQLRKLYSLPESYQNIGVSGVAYSGKSKKKD